MADLGSPPTVVSWKFPRGCRVAFRHAAHWLVAWNVIAGIAASQSPPAAPTRPATPAVPPAPEALDLETTDGVKLAVWLYRAPDATASATPRPRGAPKPTVILVHDLGGTHASVEPLALALQRAGCHVVAPDLRGHGDSTVRSGPGGKEVEVEAKSLKRGDLEAIAASTGGTVRDQANARGDLETVRDFLRMQSGWDAPGLDRLVVIGIGTGATLATQWTAADASWPPLASGPQGRQVKALVLVSPAWTPRGLPILPALGQETVKRDVPILVLAGRADKDALRVFDQLKRGRPQEWYEQRTGAGPAQAPKLEKPADATAVLLQIDADDSGEKLLASRRPDPAELIKGFLGAVLPQPRP